MAKGYIIQAKGLKELRKKFKGLSADVSTEVDGVLAVSANDFVNRAVKAAPVDTSELRQKISSDRLGVMNYEVVSAAKHSAYVEFGTITRVQVPSDLVEYAMQFKGRGILKTGGMPARPFFFVQRGPVVATMEQRLEPALKKALK